MDDDGMLLLLSLFAILVALGGFYGFAVGWLV